MAERSKRAGCIRPAHRLAMMRSIGRRCGALTRDRFKIKSWCLSSSDSENRPSTAREQQPTNRRNEKLLFEKYAGVLAQKPPRTRK